MKKAFITWVLGQDGAYMAKSLISKWYKVFGMIRNTGKELHTTFENTDFLWVTWSIEFVEGDLRDEETVTWLIKTIQPDELYNFAAQSFVWVSWQKARETTEINWLGVLTLLEAVRLHSPHTKFFQASTSEMLWVSNENGLQTEETPFHPRNPYAISKLYAYRLTNNYKESYGMFCANAILFNHESPIRGIQFVTRKITDWVARIKLNLANKIALWNLESRRDWWFAGDYVEAMRLMLQQEKPDNYILSTWVTHSIRDLLDVAFNHVWVPDWHPYIEIDPQFNRPTELLSLQWSSTKAKEKLGREPKVSFEQLIVMMVDADLERLSKEVENSN